MVNRKFAYIIAGRKLSPEVVSDISKLNLKVIDYKQEFKRFYPEGEVTGNLIGKTNIEHIATSGIEIRNNNTLKEHNGEKIVMKDRHGEIVSDIKLVSAPKNGEELM
jgi:cell division protein FtsI (penicillin-binding protein 3)